MSAMMEVVPADSLATTLVIDAYDYPRLSIKSNQDDYITYFADQAMLDCYKTMEASS